MTDIHGFIQGQEIYSSDTNEKYVVGGLSVMANIIDGLQQENEQDLIILDSGDEFTGSLLSAYWNGSVVSKILNKMNLSSGVLGNHEFDLGQQNLKERIKESEFEYVSSNLKNSSDQWSTLFENSTVKVQVIVRETLRIGVIGLTTEQTYIKTSGDLTDIDISDHYLEITTYYSHYLRHNLSCNLVLLNAHIGLTLEDDSDPQPYALKFRSNNDPQPIIINDTYLQFIDSIESSSIDAIFLGHTHNMIHQFTRNNIPVVLSQNQAKYINLVYIDYDLTQQKIKRVFLEGPVPICDKVFEKRLICDVGLADNSVRTNGPLKSYSFHNRLVKSDPQLDKIIHSYKQVLAKNFNLSVLTFVDQPIIRSTLVDFVAYTFQQACQSDVAIVNQGMVRVDWPKGKINYESIYQTIPFDDQIIKVTLNGNILKQILKDINVQYYGLANLRITLANNTITNIQIYDYQLQFIQAINPKQIYTLAYPDFLQNGGDEFFKVIKYFNPKSYSTCGMARDILSQYISNQPSINTFKNPAINPRKPKIVQL